MLQTTFCVFGARNRLQRATLVPFTWMSNLCFRRSNIKLLLFWELLDFTPVIHKLDPSFAPQATLSSRFRRLINGIIIPYNDPVLLEFSFLFVLKGGIQQSHVSDCSVTLRGAVMQFDLWSFDLSSSVLLLTFVSCQAASQPQRSWVRHFTSATSFPCCASTSPASCISSSIHQDVLFHCVITKTGRLLRSTQSCAP